MIKVNSAKTYDAMQAHDTSKHCKPEVLNSLLEEKQAKRLTHVSGIDWKPHIDCSNLCTDMSFSAVSTGGCTLMGDLVGELDSRTAYIVSMFLRYKIQNQASDPHRLLMRAAPYAKAAVVD